MTEHPKLPPALRIRVRSGPLVGKWLWAMAVSKGGLLPLQVTNWANVLQHTNKYVFKPEFVNDRSAAFRPVSPQIAEGFLNVLKTLGIDAEVVHD
jgi:hypothetical protein